MSRLFTLLAAFIAVAIVVYPVRVSGDLGWATSVIVACVTVVVILACGLVAAKKGWISDSMDDDD